MSTLKTFRLWLEPDQELPMFKRLAWERAEVSIRDVLMGGVHPWTENKEGTDVHPSLIEAFVQKLNDASVKVAELESFGYGIDVSGQQGNYYEKKTRFERTMEHIEKDVYFVKYETPAGTGAVFIHAKKDPEGGIRLIFRIGEPNPS